MRETRLSGSEGGGVANIRSPYPYFSVGPPGLTCHRPKPSNVETPAEGFTYG
jgi:hypothetical protein